MFRPPKRTRHYRAGESAPVSGIYRVTHIAHRAPHEVILIAAEEFPPCRTCRNEVSFEVLRPVSHAMHDWDLAGPAVLMEWAA
jgi:hypothetical protein